MRQKSHVNPLIWEGRESKASEAHYLVLYNDDFNSFEFVIKSLMEVCDHSEVQAEQCATITHFKGKCEIKKGINTELQPMQAALVRRNLKAVIE